MLNKTVKLKTFTIAISLMVAVVFGSLMILHYWPQDSTIATGQTESSVSSTTASEADTSRSTQKVSTIKSTGESVPDTEKVDKTTTTMAPEDASKNQVIFIGDSLLHQTDASKKLVPKLVENGWQEIAIDAQGCRPNYISVSGCEVTPSFVDVLKKIDAKSYGLDTAGNFDPQVNQDSLQLEFADDQSIVSKVSESDLNDFFRQADTVVVALGTNDNEDAEQIEVGIRQTVAAIKSNNPSISIYWVAICPHGAKKYAGGIFNPLVEKLSQELEFKVIDWASQCQASYQHDGVHYTEEGADAYTDVLAAGIK